MALATALQGCGRPSSFFLFEFQWLEIGKIKRNEDTHPQVCGSPGHSGESKRKFTD